MGDSNAGRKRSSDDDDPNGKKKKNRDAARKCREKKVMETKSLKEKNEELVKSNKDLTSKKIKLEQQLQACINEIRKHEANGCCLPSSVSDIINSTESEDFIPIGTHTAPAAINGHSNSQRYRANNMFQAMESSPIEHQPTVTGLFSGNQVPADLERTQPMSPSSRSPSRSPPPSMQPQSQLSKSNSTDSSSKLMLQPSWTRLHEQTVGQQTSQGWSPAQTVPNIDSDMYTVPDTYQNDHGFPDLHKAVQQAQEDPGVEGDDEYLNNSKESSNLLPLPQENSSTPSFGFSPNLSDPSTAPQAAQYVFHQGARQMQNAVPLFKNSDAHRPSTSGSMTVSMNHTAELLSQAMNTFEASEISEDLKKQFVQYTNNTKDETVQEKNNTSFIQNEQPVEYGDHQLVQHQQLINQVHVPAPVNNEISYEQLLAVARENEQSITIQFQGKEYTNCTFSQVQQFIKIINADNNNSPSQIVDSNSPLTVAESVQLLEGLAKVNENTQVLAQEVANTMFGQTNLYTGQNQLSTQSNTFDQRLNPVPMPQQQGNDVNMPFQLPTTVLSMIQEDSLAQTGPPVEMSLDSVDYSDNVRDLPSLSLTEDHAHIFEKKPRHNHE